MSYAQKPLPCDPTRIKGMSEKLIRSHRFHYLRFANPDSVAATDSRSASNPATTAPGSQPRRTDSRTQMLLTALAVFSIAVFSIAVFSIAAFPRVPLAQQADARKKFTWLNVCIAAEVLRDRKLNYVFRPHQQSDLPGAASCDYINYYAKSKFGVEPKNLKVAIIHEDGPYGVGVAAGNESQCKKHGMQIVLKEGYAETAL